MYNIFILFFILFIIIILIDYFNLIKNEIKIIKDNKHNKIIGVISRYNEDLNWINEYPFNQIKYIVYNKSNNNNFYKNNVIKIINLKNVGRESHTFLYHIIKNYDNLDDITVFLPGSIDLFYKKLLAKEIINKIIKYNKAIILAQTFNNLFKKKLYNFKVNN